MNTDMLETLDFWLEVLRYSEKLEVKTEQQGQALTLKVEVKVCKNIPYMVGGVLEVMVNADKLADNKGQASLLHTPEKYRNTPEGRYLKRSYKEYVKRNTFYAGFSMLSSYLFAGFLKKAAEYSKLEELEKAYEAFQY